MLAFTTFKDGLIGKIQIPKESLNKCQESTDIYDPTKAMYYCFEATILNIYKISIHLHSESHKDVVNGRYDYTKGSYLHEGFGTTFSYNVGDKVMHKMHYFLKEDIAHWHTFKSINPNVLIENNYNGITINYHDNGRLRYRGEFKMGIPSGFIKGWYPSGILKYECMYVDGEPTGTSRSFYENGQIKHITYRKLLYQWDLYYHKNGNIKSTTKKYYGCVNNTPDNYQGLNGYVKEWYSNGQIKMKVHYHNNLKSGIYQLWDENGIKIQESYYIAYKSKNLLHGPSLYWDMFGNINIKVNYKNGLMNGLYRSWYTGTQQLYNVCKYKNGVINGIDYKFYENGQVLQCAYKINDKLFGTYKRFYENGQLERYALFEKGYEILDIQYYVNGIINIFTTKTQTKKGGLDFRTNIKKFNVNGQLIKKTKVKRYYDYSFKIYMCRFYDNGQIKEIIKQYRSGKIKRLGWYEDISNRSPTGQQKFRICTKDPTSLVLPPLKHGKQLKWYQNGNLKIRELWNDGKLLEKEEYSLCVQ